VSRVTCPQCENACEEEHKFCPVCGFPIGQVAGKSDDPMIGSTLPGGYVILELVGVGGMGRVYRAEQQALGRTVAVKIIHPHLHGDESTAARFITEARAASRLNHPNSVAVIDFGKNGNQLYLVMEFLRGKDLARVMYEEGYLPFPRIIDVATQTLAALSEAHHLDIIHRDLKPENIVLEPRRTGGDMIKVVDFGLAKIQMPMRSAAGMGPNKQNITMPGIVCGTPDYMSPEQGRGEDIDNRSDLYAMGVILFQLLTGRLPFEADSPTQVLLMHVSKPPPNPQNITPERDIPNVLADITLRALSKNPEDRYATADEFAKSLNAALDEIRPNTREARASFSDEPASGRFSWTDGVVCSQCRAFVPRGQKFCGDCGARVTQPSPAPASRRPVTGSPDAARQAAISGAIPGYGSPSQGALGGIPRLPLAFTGREDDIEWLEGARFEVSGSVCGARIIGDAGVGKTRLIEEFLGWCQREGDFVVRTGPDPWLADLGYHALRHAIIGLAGLPPGGGDPATWVSATAEARRGLGEVFGRGDRRPDQQVTPTWIRTSGILSVEDRRFMAAEALRWAMLRASDTARGKKIVLAVDDLHAVDGASRNALNDVVNEPPLCGVLVLGTHVPGFEPGWQGSERIIAGLPTDTALQVARGLPRPRGSSSPPIEGSIESMRDAKTVLPLYIEQLVRFTLEGGVDAPARLGDMIATRVERLPPDARRALQAIAVLGDCTAPMLLGGFVKGMSQLDEVVGVLVHAGMVEKRGSVLATTHPLVREVVLAMIPAGARRDIHVRALASADEAEVPVEVAPQSIAPLGSLPVEVRALHAFHAQDAFEALMLLETVANRAWSRGDLEGAVLALRRGLDLARREMFRGEIDDPERAVLIFARKLGEALAAAGSLTDADGVLREALDLAGPSGVDRARVLGTLAFVAHQRERRSDADAMLREALEIARVSHHADLLSSLEKLRREWRTTG
jgi:serine/threonine protein kinase